MPYQISTGIDVGPSKDRTVVPWETQKIRTGFFRVLGGGHSAASWSHHQGARTSTLEGEKTLKLTQHSVLLVHQEKVVGEKKVGTIKGNHVLHNQRGER